MPRPKKMTPKAVKVIMVDLKDGMGLHAGSVCYLKREALSFSTFSKMRFFSSSVFSIY